MRLETQVWVIVATDRKGRPRGFEKVSRERFFLIEDEAHAVLKDMPDDLRGFFVVAEARIGYPEFDE